MRKTWILSVISSILIEEIIYWLFFFCHHDIHSFFYSIFSSKFKFLIKIEKLDKINNHAFHEAHNFLKVYTFLKSFLKSNLEIYLPFSLNIFIALICYC